MQDSSGLRIRVDGQLRQEFISACRSHDRAAAQVLREFMRDYVAKHYSGQQESLFSEESKIPSIQNV